MIRLTLSTMAGLVCLMLSANSPLAQDRGNELNPSNLRQVETVTPPAQAAGGASAARPAPQAHTYGQVIVEQPSVTGQSDDGSEDRAKIAAYFRDALVSRLRNYYVPTTAEGPGVAMVRTSISGVGSSLPKEPGIWANTGATYIQAKLRAANERSNPLAGAVLTAEAYDTGTGRRLGEFTQQAPVTSNASWEQTQQILDGWAQEITVWMAG